MLVNVARSLGTKTIHYTLLDPLLAMYLSTRAMDRLTKARVYVYVCVWYGRKEGSRSCR